MEPIAAILLGLAGGFHCIGMCGPIALALPVQRTPQQHVARVLYQLGRIFTYAVLGAIAGVGASTVSIVATERVVSITAGSLMVVAAIAQLSFHRSIIPSAPLLRITSPVRSRLQVLLQRNSLVAMSGIGMLNGLLPCGLVLAALFGAASTGSAVQGAAFMSFFGLGTLPIMTAVMFGVGVLSARMRTVLKTAIPVLTIAVGALLIVRGMGLGIPYVSPQHEVHGKVDCCAPSAHVHER